MHKWSTRNIPETHSFEMRKLQGMLELVSLTGNIVQEEDGSYTHHTHGMFAYKEGEKHKVAGGHLKTIGISYTAELELRPVIGGRIMHKYNEETGTGFWTFAEGLDD